MALNSAFRIPHSQFRIGRAGVTQLVACLPFKQGVVGSTPTAGTFEGGMRNAELRQSEPPIEFPVWLRRSERRAENVEVLVRLQPPGLGSAECGARNSE